MTVRGWAWAAARHAGRRGSQAGSKHARRHARLYCAALLQPRDGPRRAIPDVRVATDRARPDKIGRTTGGRRRCARSPKMAHGSDRAISRSLAAASTPTRNGACTWNRRPARRGPVRRRLPCTAPRSPTSWAPPVPLDTAATPAARLPAPGALAPVRRAVAVAAASADRLPRRRGGGGVAGRLPGAPGGGAAAGPHRHGDAPGLRAHGRSARDADARAVRGRASSAPSSRSAIARSRTTTWPGVDAVLAAGAGQHAYVDRFFFWHERMPAPLRAAAALLPAAW